METGSPQLGDTSQNIGPRPNLQQAISQLHRAILVALDIKPGDFRNSINPANNGVTPVAILTTNSFDATTVDPITIRFGRNGTEAAAVHSAHQDVNGDGNIDLILHFKTRDTGIQCGDTSAAIIGQTFSGQAIEGFDSVNTTGCNLKHVVASVLTVER